MDKIYTSYYSRIGNFNPTEFIRIQISRYCPVPDYIDLKFTDLYPSKELLQSAKDGVITNEEYTAEYLGQLEEVTFGKLQSQFNRLLKSKKDIVLFCYESPEKFCHRHILAGWYNKNSNQNIIMEYENL